MYGTAWKEERTEELTRLAIDAGYRAIDTANQRRHYHEAAVGEAVGLWLKRGKLRREDLFLQTKYTFLPGQDRRLPYDPEAPIAAQVEQSVQSSLAHLQTDFLDSLLLHGPSRRFGLGAADWEAWGAMEGLAERGVARVIGVSNVSAEQLESLLDRARRPPVFVQNRCFARMGWDADVRRLCRARGIAYQAFSLLTANVEVLQSPLIRRIAGRLRSTIPQVIFCFARAAGMLPVTGTSDPEHMRQDIESLRLELSDEEVRLIESSSAV